MAGQRGNFALVIGVERNKKGELARNGANWVINDFCEIDVDEVIAFFADTSYAA